MIKAALKFSLTILLLMTTSPSLAGFDYTKYDMDVAGLFVEIHDWVHQTEMTEKEFLKLYKPVSEKADLKSLQQAVRQIYKKASAKGVSNRTFVLSLHRLILRENPMSRGSEKQLLKDSISF